MHFSLKTSVGTSDDPASGGARATSTLEPILPLSRTDHVHRQKAVRDRVREDAIPKIARADHPPVVNDSSGQAHVPKGAMFGCEEAGGQQERRGREGSERYPFEILRI